jgi:spore coat protein U-like protein
MLAAWMLVVTQAAWPATVCRFSSGMPDMGFGAYDILSATPTDTQLDVNVQCDRTGGPQNTTIELGIGQGANGTSVANRRLALSGGSDVLNYGLFRDSGRSAVWGVTNGIDTASITLAIPNNGSQTGTFRVFGRIPARQNVGVGTYTDRIQMILSP